MTRGDVFLQILHEVSGKPKEFLSDILEAFKSAVPGQHKFDEEMSDADGEKLLAQLRMEKEGIRQWLIKGYLQVVLDKAEPHGHA